jgi:hypothetical protein
MYASLDLRTLALMVKLRALASPISENLENSFHGKAHANQRE